MSAGSPRRELTAREVEHAAALYAEGCNVRQVARALGVSRVTAAQVASALQNRITERKAATA